MVVTELSEKNFDSTIKSGYTVVDFWAAWCGPCRMLSPVVEAVSEEYKGKIKFGKVNVDENQNLAQRYAVMSIPTVILFKDGKVLDTSIGAVPRDRLKKWLDEKAK